MRSISTFLALAICLYAGITALVYFRQHSLLYYPDITGRELARTPLQIGLEYEDVILLTEDGLRVHGWFIPREEARGTLLFFHGNAGNISHRLESIAIFNTLRLNVFIIDYRGYGQSEGEVNEQGTYLDAEAAWRHLVNDRGIDAGEIIVFGRSLGAAIAARVASREQPAGLILESGFSSVPSMGKRLYPFLPVEWLSNFSYDTRAYAGRVTSPVLVAHSKSDNIVPYAEGRVVFDAIPGEKTFLEMRGGHNDGFYVTGPAYLDGFDRFLQNVLAESTSN